MQEVVSGLIIMPGSLTPRSLLTQRRADQDYPFHWETPGGKVEHQESHHQALRRELDEEVGISGLMIPERALWCGEVAIPNGAVWLALYVVQSWATWSGYPTPREGQGIGWFTAEELTRLKLMPGNQAALDRIVSYMAALTIGRYHHDR